MGLAGDSAEQRAGAAKPVAAVEVTPSVDMESPDLPALYRDDARHDTAFDYSPLNQDTGEGGVSPTESRDGEAMDSGIRKSQQT
jgi:hypothetical protein